MWSQQAKLTASDAANEGYFGSSVSLTGDTALVGAYGDDHAGDESGAAYVFVRAGTVWSQQAKLTASDAANEDRFGESVSLWGKTALVGAWGDDDAGKDSGSAYVFARTGTAWSQQAKLTASTAAAYDYFGWSVSLFRDTALVGAFGDDPAGTFSGSACVFVRNGTAWNQQAKLVASDAAPADYFGTSVSLFRNAALVGAPHEFHAGGSAGSAYVFEWLGTMWRQQAKLTASDAAGGDYFGWSVSLSGDTALVGAWGDDDAGSESGSAYVFAGLPAPVGYCTAKLNSQGCLPAIGHLGAPTLSGLDDFYVTAANVLNDKVGILIWSHGPNNLPFMGGTLCIAPPIVRTPPQNSGGNPPPLDCSGSFYFHFSQAYMASKSIAAGTRLYAQYWSRDPGFAPPNDVGLTEGLEFVVGL